MVPTTLVLQSFLFICFLFFGALLYPDSEVKADPESKYRCYQHFYLQETRLLTVWPGRELAVSQVGEDDSLGHNNFFTPVNR